MVYNLIWWCWVQIWHWKGHNYKWKYLFCTYKFLYSHIFKPQISGCGNGFKFLLLTFSKSSIPGVLIDQVSFFAYVCFIICATSNIHLFWWNFHTKNGILSNVKRLTWTIHISVYNAEVSQWLLFSSASFEFILKK